ncbi:hypothetical protein BV22DRAFT_1011455 [Leucogyrophana mollusca]|uniref:Uncharacterized protein n=1 Tax=Leucogyrophana mollusca TaxID=85980 RepID=A0ACB8BHS1_9AGAM|nr:hypothetical protein BV22DRAFT_1011455 [Leucogyrophana mollusca]
MRTRSSKVQRSSNSPNPRPQRANPIHWLFRSNLPGRRGSAYSSDLGRRNFFGMSEIFSVILNPSETVRSLTESKRLLEEARNEINEERERSQLRTKHTFSRLPGFLPREAETRAIERALEGEPSFTVLFGASSVGKTALLREVLSREAYHVLHFDLRIPGFADISSLYMSLSQQMEQYFETIAKTLPGYGDFQKEAWGFKHDRLSVERRLNESPVGSIGSQVKTSDIARLMELFQSSLLKYWEFDPPPQTDKNGTKAKKGSDVSSDRTHVEATSPKSRWFFKRKGQGSSDGRRSTEDGSCLAKEKEPQKPVKKMPVLFFDEAHKLPALIQSTETMKCLLDSMLVLTKQDRLCHVIHATSDPFYQTWLRQLNVMQHCKIITIGDCTKAETHTFFIERLLPRVPEPLRPGLSFEIIYDAFGGKLAHWQDYINDYVNAGGNLDIKQSSHFLQAHAVLNLHIIHSSQNTATTPVVENPSRQARPRSSGPDALHSGLGPAGFKVYSAISNPHKDASGMTIGEDYSADFSAMQLLKVMSKLSQPGATYLPYFLHCREIGVRAVDGMVKGRVLDLHWTDPVRGEGESGLGVMRDIVTPIPAPLPIPGSVGTLHNPSAIQISGSGTAVGIESSEDGEMVMVNPVNLDLGRVDEEEPEEVVGPKLMPLTPIMRYAMREVVQEYEEVRTVSEYASLSGSEVDEY